MQLCAGAPTAASVSVLRTPDWYGVQGHEAPARRGHGTYNTRVRVCGKEYAVKRDEVTRVGAENVFDADVRRWRLLTVGTLPPAMPMDASFVNTAYAQWPRPTVWAVGGGAARRPEYGRCLLQVRCGAHDMSTVLSYAKYRAYYQQFLPGYGVRRAHSV